MPTVPIPGNKTSTTSASISIFDFKFLKVLGSGMSGVVYKTKHVHTGHVYATKRLIVKLGHSRRMSYDAKTELKVLEMTNGQPHLIGLENAFRHQDTLMFVMNYAAGGTLASRMAATSNSEKLTATQFKLLVAEIICGLKQLHALSILHNDLSERNWILISLYMQMATLQFQTMVCQRCQHIALRVIINS